MFWKKLHEIRVAPTVRVTIDVMTERDCISQPEEVNSQARTLAALGRLLRRVTNQQLGVMPLAVRRAAPERTQ